MLNTDDFIHQLIERGYSHLCVVPCSFAKNLINSSINHSDKIEYVPCASEAIACSVAAGLAISGKMPIVIAQSSGLTNMGSCITSLLEPYKIRFPIIVSWRTYQLGDSEIQHKHLAKHLPNLVLAYGYDYEVLDKNNIDKSILQIDSCWGSNLICILEEGTFSSVKLLDSYQIDISKYLKRSEYLRCMNMKFKGNSAVFIGTTGNTSREMYHYMPETNNFYMAGNMGGALSLGLGAAKAGKKVIICGGDAEFVMHLGGLTTAGRYENLDLTYIVFDNKSNKSTGGQGTYQDHLDYCKVAAASGFNSVFNVSSISEFSKQLENTLENQNISFIRARCSYDSSVPRPNKDSIIESKNVFNN
jgi:sulfopyruvate decarboxylase